MTCFTLIEKYKFLWTLKIFSIVAACLLPVSQASIIPFLLATLIVKHSKLHENIIKNFKEKELKEFFTLIPVGNFLLFGGPTKGAFTLSFKMLKRKFHYFLVK